MLSFPADSQRGAWPTVLATPVVDLTVVVPAYDEEQRLPPTLDAICRYLRNSPARQASWELIVVDDGSTDDTAAVVRAVASAEPRIRLLRAPCPPGEARARNHGKGHAVRTGVLASRGRRVLLADADLATPIEELASLHDRLDEGFAAAIGSRACPEARIEAHQPPLRRLLGKAGNLAVRATVLPGIRDTQCGFKLFDGDCARAAFGRSRTDGWGIDVEILRMFRQARLAVAEVPVNWSHREGSKVTARTYAEVALELVRLCVRGAPRATLPGERPVVPARRAWAAGPAAGPATSSVAGAAAGSGEAEPRAGRGERWALAAVLFALYAAVSVRSHLRLRTTGYDLGIFEQAVRSYAHGRLPVAELKGPGFALLGDHFSPVLALLAPVYRACPSPVTLLVAQAALLAVAVVPLTGWAQQVAGRGAAAVVGFGYGASWGIAQAVGFDFHEICFAVPLLAWSLTALGRGRLRTAALWALPLLLVKEDLGLTVAVIGLLIAHRGARRWGLATAATGLAGTVLTVLVLIPAFNPDHTFAYWDKLPGTSAGGGDLLSQFFSGVLGILTPETKVHTLLFLLAPCVIPALSSRLLLVAVPTLLWRFASDNSAYWGTDYHYSATLMPVVFAAFVEGLAIRRDAQRTVRQGLTVCVVVTALLLPQFPLWQLTQSGTWRTPPRVATAHRLLARIPDGATVAASNRLVPQLTDRTRVSVFGMYGSRPRPRWIIVDTADPQGWPITPRRERALLDTAVERGYRTVAERSGYVLLKR